MRGDGFPGAAFDRWLVFSGNPYERDADPVMCRECETEGPAEDNFEGVCVRCLRAARRRQRQAVVFAESMAGD